MYFYREVSKAGVWRFCIVVIFYCDSV